MKKINIVEYVLIVAGVSLSLTQIYTIMGIILLAFQIGLIIAKIIIKVVGHVKAGKLDEAVKAIEDGQKEIEDATNKNKYGK